MIKPIEKILPLVTIAGGIFGLASLADAIIAWRGFILKSVELYQAIFHQYFLGLVEKYLAISINTDVFDYLFIGFFLARSILIAKPANDLRDERNARRFVAFMFFVLWPMMLPATTIGYFNTFNKHRLEEDRAEIRSNFKSAGMTLLLFLLLVVLNQVIDKW